MRSRAWHHFLGKSSYACQRTATGGCMLKLCQRRREKIYLASELKNKPVPTRALAAADEMRKTKQVLSSTRWFHQGANDQNTRGLRAGCRSFIRPGCRLSCTVDNYKPKTSNRKLPLPLFFLWLVCGSTAQIHRSLLLLNMYMNNCD